MDLGQHGLFLGGAALVNELLMVFHAFHERRARRAYHDRQVAELDRRERVGLHSRRVRVDAPGGPVVIGYGTYDDAPGDWTRQVHLKSVPIVLRDEEGRSIALEGGVDLHAHHLPGAVWRGPSGPSADTWELCVSPEQGFYVLVEEPPGDGADPYRQAPAVVPAARVTRAAKLANPALPVEPRYEIGHTPRDFDFALERRGPFPALLFTLLQIGLLVAVTKLSPHVGFLWVAEGILFFFALPGLLFTLPLPRRQPREAPRTWQAPAR